MNEDSMWVMSRKITIKSMARHFAAWKTRQFVLDRPNALLGIRTKDNLKMTLVPLAQQSISVRHHYYSNDKKFCLSLKYIEDSVDSSGEKEMIIKFESLEKMNRWNTSLSEVIRENQKVFTEKSKLYFDTFGDYLREQSNLQRVLGRDYHMHTVTPTTSPGHKKPSSNAEQTGFAVGDQLLADNNISSLNHNDGGPVASLAETSAASSTTTNYHSKAMIRSNNECDFWQIPVPKLRILIMAVGTRGDMQPFVQLGLRLQADGHRVRIATHASFRSYIMEKGLEFYPLAGDPAKLSEFMVKTHGFIIPTTTEQLRAVPEHHSMIVDIMYSCWNACIDPDPEDELNRPFVADAIISNPVTYAHIHCAEALGVPLHLMFPQPWIPTKAFPHPLSCLSYSHGWCSENYISYQVIDRMLWLSFESSVNTFRKSVLGLQPIRVGEGGWNMLNLNRVPFVKMWSPTLVPKPKDWPDYVDVVGTFFEQPLQQKQQQRSTEAVAESLSHQTDKVSEEGTTIATAGAVAAAVAPEYTPSPELASFLANKEVPIVFIGFGSMVIQDIESLISLFLEAAALSNVRVLIQMGWTSITAERFHELAVAAQKKTELVRQTMFMNRSLADSVIFPEDNIGSTTVTDDELRVRLQTTESVDEGDSSDYHTHFGSDSPERAAAERKGRNTGGGGNGGGVNDVSGEKVKPIPPRVARRKSGAADVGVDGAADGPVPDNKLPFPLTTSASARVSSSSTAAPASTHSSGGHHQRSSSQGDSSPHPTLSAPSNMITGWFYTALSTFVKPKGEESAATSNSAAGASASRSGSLSEKPSAVKDSSAAASGSAATAKKTERAKAHGGQASDIAAAKGRDKTSKKTNKTDNKNNNTAVEWDGGDPLTTATNSAAAAATTAFVESKWNAQTDCFFMGPCPHSWLFTQVDAVVHHGGAGTTAAGLRYGCPTWICPFFGDQFFWGELVHRGGLGPRPAPIDTLNLALVAESLAALRSDEMRTAASEISKILAVEDGVEGAVEAFYRHLPVENMICDVSMFKGEARLAQVFCKDCGFKMCSEVSDAIHGPDTGREHHTLSPCSYMNWTVPEPTSAASGIVQGLGGLVHELAEGVSDVIYDPVKGIYTEGLTGAATGLVTGVQSLLTRPIKGGNLLVNRVSTGIRNSLGYQDIMSPIRTTADGESATGIVYGVDAHSSDQNKQIRRLRMMSIDSNNSTSGVNAANAAAGKASSCGGVKMDISSPQSGHSNSTTGGDDGPHSARSERSGSNSSSCASVDTATQELLLGIIAKPSLTQSLSNSGSSNSGSGGDNSNEPLSPHLDVLLANSSSGSINNSVNQIDNTPAGIAFSDAALLTQSTDSIQSVSNPQSQSQLSQTVNNNISEDMLHIRSVMETEITRVLTTTATATATATATTTATAAVVDGLTTKQQSNEQQQQSRLPQSQSTAALDAGHTRNGTADSGSILATVTEGNTCVNDGDDDGDERRDQRQDSSDFDVSVDGSSTNSSSRQHSRETRISSDDVTASAAFLLSRQYHKERKEKQQELGEAKEHERPALPENLLAAIRMEQEQEQQHQQKEQQEQQKQQEQQEELENWERHQQPQQDQTPQSVTQQTENMLSAVVVGDTLSIAPTLSLPSGESVDIIVTAPPLSSSTGDTNSAVMAAFEQAQAAQRMFRLMGAKSARFMSLDTFTQSLYRALIRRSATTANSNNSGGDVVTGGGVRDDQDARLSAAESLNVETVTALVKLLARNKRYLDLVDFFLVYQEIIQGGQVWVNEPERIISS